MTIALIAFFGSFRIHELLSRDREKFDLQSTLLGQNVKIEHWPEKNLKVLKITLKSPKEIRFGLGITIEISQQGIISVQWLL